MIKISIDESVVNKFYCSVKDYIGKHLFTLSPEKEYFTDKKIEEIIKCKPDSFQEIIDEINSKKLNLDIIQKAFKGTKSTKETKGFSFGYSVFSKKDRTQSQVYYRAYDLAKALNVNVCPYCNKNYTYTIVDEEGEQYTRPDFDHFLSQSKYPYFAMSFYNLIPSCITCNRILKHTKEFLLTTHIHPYKDNFHSIKKFSTTKPLILCNEEKEFDIDFKNKTSNADLIKKADGNIRDFALILQYSKHKDIVLELKEKYELYNDSSVNNILKDTRIFKHKGEEYIKALVLGSVIKNEDISKRPLSKLIKDISEQLELR